ncbi:MAG: sigma-70 family RNA polymerase sigma factor [Acidimicrobiales bacterium]
MKDAERETGSPRLLRIAAGTPTTADLVLQTDDMSNQDTRNTILDSLAKGASTGSMLCLDGLLAAIDEYHLDRSSIRRLIIDDHDAEDVHQDVLIAVSRSIRRFRSDSSFNTWLFTVARNTAINHLRRQRDTVALDEDEPMTAAQRLSSMIATRSTLRAALGELPDHYRDVVVLRDVEQKSYDEIADVLDIKINTVKSRINRGRALVAQSIRDEIDETK